MVEKPSLAKIPELRDRIMLIDLVSWGQINAVKELIEKSGDNLDINEINSNGDFAAIIAAQRNDLPMLELLVENGAKLDMQDGRGRTVRGWAEYNKNSKMLEFIDEKLNIIQKCELSELKRN